MNREGKSCHIMIFEKINVLKKNIIFECTDTWKKTMATWQKKQEEKIFGIEHKIICMNNSIRESQRVIRRLQDDVLQLDEMVSQHELVIPGL